MVLFLQVRKRAAKFQVEQVIDTMLLFHAIIKALKAKCIFKILLLFSRFSCLLFTFHRLLTKGAKQTGPLGFPSLMKLTIEIVEIT